MFYNLYLHASVFNALIETTRLVFEALDESGDDLDRHRFGKSFANHLTDSDQLNYAKIEDSAVYTV